MANQLKTIKGKKTKPKRKFFVGKIKNKNAYTLIKIHPYN